MTLAHHDKQPLVSVCIPAYNHERYIVQALDSVFEQDWLGIELVIINDGSKDTTPTLIESWIEEHRSELKINYTSRPNRGLVPTFNELVLMAEGKYIAWLASDDYLLPGSLSARVAYLQKHSEKKAVFGDALVVDEKGNITYQSAIFDLHKGIGGSYADAESLKKELLFRWSIPGPVLMLEKSVYTTLGFYDESLPFEDWEFYLRLACHNLIGFLDQTVAAYRWHDACISRNAVRDVAAIELDILKFNRFREFYPATVQAEIDKKLSWLNRKKTKRKIQTFLRLR